MPGVGEPLNLYVLSSITTEPQNRTLSLQIANDWFYVPYIYLRVVVIIIIIINNVKGKVIDNVAYVLHRTGYFESVCLQLSFVGQEVRCSIHPPVWLVHPPFGSCIFFRTFSIRLFLEMKENV